MTLSAFLSRALPSGDNTSRGSKSRGNWNLFPVHDMARL